MNSITFVGNATIILDIDGMRILVDPSFIHDGKTKHLGWGLFSKRLVAPAMILSDIKNIDYILVTHIHTDHFDINVDELGDIPMITNKVAAVKLKRRGFNCQALVPGGEPLKIGDIEIRAVYAQHGPRIMIPFTGSVIGFFITSNKHRIWISGDTITHDRLVDQLAELKPNTTVINLGAARAYVFRLTYNGREAGKILHTLENLEKVIAVHIDEWSHFNTTREEVSSELMGDYKLYIPKPGEIIEI